MQGWRGEMEDAHTVELSLPKHSDIAFFGIFDGHDGNLCSEYMAKRLVKDINEMNDVFDESALAQVCMDCDQSFLRFEKCQNRTDGTAAIFSLVQFMDDGKSFRTLHANIGDSRIILAKWKGEGQGYEAIPCTFDHKPSNPEEEARIEATGGNVVEDRVDGDLAVSRAFGDVDFKIPEDLPPQDRRVSSSPDFTSFEATSKDFLLLCCDGIYEGNIFKRQEVIDWLALKLKESNDIAKVCAELLDECLDRGSKDNMSAMIVQFKNGEDYRSNKFEYVPGPFDKEWDFGFIESYKADALAAGYSLEQALELYKKIEGAE